MRVHLWGELGFYGPGRRSRFEFRLEQPVPLAEALRLIGVPMADITVLAVNGEAVDPGDPAITVSDADRLDCVPPTSGG